MLFGRFPSPRPRTLAVVDFPFGGFVSFLVRWNWGCAGGGLYFLEGQAHEVPFPKLRFMFRMASRGVVRLEAGKCLTALRVIVVVLSVYQLDVQIQLRLSTMPVDFKLPDTDPICKTEVLNCSVNECEVYQFRPPPLCFGSMPCLHLYQFDAYNCGIVFQRSVVFMTIHICRRIITSDSRAENDSTGFQGRIWQHLPRNTYTRSFHKPNRHSLGSYIQQPGRRNGNCSSPVSPSTHSRYPTAQFMSVPVTDP